MLESQDGAELHPKDRGALARFVADLRTGLGDALEAVALIGEAASRAYRPRRSPLSTAVVVAEVTPEALRQTRRCLRRFGRRALPTPLVLDRAYIAGALDVFPMEFLEIADHHVRLYGDEDPFADLAIDLPHLRLQVEEQLRGKMLHLWEAYLEVGGSRRALRRLLLETPAGFEVILRGMLRLRQGEARSGQLRPDAEELVAAVEREIDVRLPTFHRLEKLRSGEDRIAAGELEASFEGYLSEVRVLVRAIDSL